ncbi:DUF1768 domain containing protein [Trichuris trichiura]|uniref:DUF1768 domain containing protein n=1 Tax=Trichuris trichiura TaxID=36087 RepID=A0A077YZR6_TRITR|nr:DUF1768 domain containing protein [Trichuris trichiura]
MADDRLSETVIVTPIPCAAHPLSVFYEYNFNVEDVLYRSFIHFYAHRLFTDIGYADERKKQAIFDASPLKAYELIFNDALMEAFSVFSQEQIVLLSDCLINYTWCILYEFCLSRLTQDVEFKSLLASLRGNILIEVNADKIFGILADEEVLRDYFLYGGGRSMTKAQLLQCFSLNLTEEPNAPIWWGRNLNGSVLMQLRSFINDDNAFADVQIGRAIDEFRSIYEQLKVSSQEKLHCDSGLESDSSSDSFVSDGDAFSSNLPMNIRNVYLFIFLCLGTVQNIWQRSDFTCFRCCKRVINFSFLPLEENFEALSTTCNMPIVAGETLYPSVEHYVAALFLRFLSDMNRLEAAKVIPTVDSRSQLRALVAESSVGLPDSVIQNWRTEKMYTTLKLATDLKFAQYPELKDLLLLTGDRTLLEMNSFDNDWSVGMSWVAFKEWMERERVTPAMVAFWMLHTDYRPGILGANLNGLLLMDIRRNLPESIRNLRAEEPDRVILDCPMECNKSSPIVGALASGSNFVLVGSPSSPLSSEFPSTFITNDQCYGSVEDYVKKKIQEHFATMVLPTERTTKMQLWLLEHVEELYKEATTAKFEQNALCRKALLSTGDSQLLVVVRPSCLPSLSTDLGCYDGTESGFVQWAEENRISADFLCRCWANGDQVPRMCKIGNNKLGLHLMKLRSSECSTDAVDVARFFKSSPVVWAPCNGQAIVPDERFFELEQLVFSDKVELIQGAESPLSIYYLAPFTICRLTFYSVEHFYWFQVLLAGGFVHSTDHLPLVKRLLQETDACKLESLITSELSGKVVAGCTPLVNKSAMYDLALREKFSQNPELIGVLCDQRCPVLVSIPDDKISNMAFEAWMQKWGIGAATLVRWFTEPNLCPRCLGGNSYGLMLMQLREQYRKAFGQSQTATNVVSVSPFSANALADLCKFGNEIFVFNSSHPLSPEAPHSLAWNNRTYRSASHLYWSQCFLALGSEEEEIDFSQNLQLEDVLRTKNCLDRFVAWRDSEEGKAAIQLCVDLMVTCNEELKKSLMQTADLPLAYCNQCDLYLGVGMTGNALQQFCNEVAGSAKLLYFWMVDPSASPHSLGRNLWGRLLMSIRRDLLRCNEISHTMLPVQPCNIFEEGNFVPPLSLFDQLSRRNPFCRLVYPWEAEDCERVYRNFQRHQQDGELGNVSSNPSVPTAMEAYALVKDVDHVGGNLLKMLERSVFSGETSLLSLVDSDAEAYSMGRQIALKFAEVFCPASLDFGGLQSDDLYNLGRFIGFWQDNQSLSQKSQKSNNFHS